MLLITTDLLPLVTGVISDAPTVCTIRTPIHRAGSVRTCQYISDIFILARLGGCSGAGREIQVERPLYVLKWRGKGMVAIRAREP